MFPFGPQLLIHPQNIIQGFAIHNADRSRHQFRIPDYHRLDFSVTINGKEFKRNGERKMKAQPSLVSIML